MHTATYVISPAVLPCTYPSFFAWLPAFNVLNVNATPSPRACVSATNTVIHKRIAMPIAMPVGKLTSFATKNIVSFSLRIAEQCTSKSSLLHKAAGHGRSAVTDRHKRSILRQDSVLHFAHVACDFAAEDSPKVAKHHQHHCVCLEDASHAYCISRKIFHRLQRQHAERER